MLASTPAAHPSTSMTGSSGLDGPAGPTIVVGVDTHKDVHHAAVLTALGQRIADQAFPATRAGYEALRVWADAHGTVEGYGIELTGSYGAALTRHLQAAGARVREVNTTDKATRARRGKDDRSDAIAAAQKLLAGMATSTPKDTTGEVEAVRIVMNTLRAGKTGRTRAINELKDCLVTADAAIREQITGISGIKHRLAAITALDPDQAGLGVAARTAIRALQHYAREITFHDAEIKDAKADLAALVTPLAPTLLARPNVGIHVAGQLLVTAAQNIDRISSEAAFARLCGIAPVPVSSGKTTRMRLHRGGDRQANSAVYMVVIGRFKTDPATRAYRDARVGKKAGQKSKKDVIRLLKRYVIRDLYRALKTDLNRT